MKLGLALGGGGARGSAHIGVLEEILPMGFQPDLITGTSIGALVGAMMAANYTTDDMHEVMEKMKPSALYGLPSGGDSVISNERVKALMERILKEHFADRLQNRDPQQVYFSDLSIPLAVVAADLVTQREVVLDEGDLVTALLATISVPILFPPVAIGEKQLVDGGLVNNLPFDVARSRSATFTIAVDLSNSAPYGTQPIHNKEENILDIGFSGVMEGRLLDQALYRATRRPLWQVITSVIDIVNAQNTQINLALSPPDVLIRPDIGTIGLLDFDTVEQGIEAGRQAARDAKPQLEKLLEKMEREKESENDRIVHNPDHQTT